nr:MAG TPA: hypothetical protein [Caudoviricetes sp.]
MHTSSELRHSEDKSGLLIHRPGPCTLFQW